ncbi:glycosyltransferase [Antarcticibacterium flavum]|uniref:Glycosyltransferase n=1 Tax=Antarcticibacterium flavum TaxID=2058175 RepID=A0A5B7X213_9FLAO|nr:MULTISPECIES: glycosyltransferase family 10 [Antarcticibacterium]MCM4158793.1 glycosyltransferase [Antarcticibacterium sp. W02-3]QCY68643.1 glycosyltransferase [Antarcticibacterium flavum]
MKTIKLWFSDFYDSFDPEENYFSSLLSSMYNLVLSPDDPDFLIYSCYGNDYLNYDCVRIYYTGENLRPDFNLCDYAIGFDHMDFGERYFRYPNFAFLEDQFLQLLKTDGKKTAASAKKDYFCNFIYANSQADPARDRFFHLLNQYKAVSSPGRHLNNISMEVGERFAEDWMYTKLDFQSRCKFTIAFENTSSPGYTTEKLLHAYITGTIPIYWGNPEVTKDFNPDSLINCHDFKNFEEVVERVKEVDQNEELYRKILQEPAYRGNTIPPQLQKEKLVAFMKNIFDKNKEEAIQRPGYGTTLKYENSLKDLHRIKSRYEKLQPYLKYLKPFKKL